MAGKRGIEGARLLAGRPKSHRGGNERPLDRFERSSPDALAVWCGHYLDHLRSHNYSEATVDGRLFCLNMFLGWAAERDVTSVMQVTRPILEAYQRWLWRFRQPRNGRPLGWSTQREKIGILRDLFRWLTRQNVLLHNPASELELPRPEKRLPQTPLARAEVERLLAVPDVRDPLSIRDRAILEVFYSTGLRRTELCRLAFSDFSLERRTLTVRQGKGKKDRVVPVGEQACHWLERYLREVRLRLEVRAGEPALFLTGYGGPFNPDVVSGMVSRWMEQAGLAKRGSCHLLRHTCATHMLEGGADVRYIQQLLGHENLETTAIYTEVSIRQLQEVHARCHPTGRMKADLPAGAAPV